MVEGEIPMSEKIILSFAYPVIEGDKEFRYIPIFIHI
jgi:hypothetical protein